MGSLAAPVLSACFCLLGMALYLVGQAAALIRKTPNIYFSDRFHSRGQRVTFLLSSPGMMPERVSERRVCNG